MGVPTRYVLHQGPVLRALGEGALTMLRQQLGAAPASAGPLPGRELTAVLSPRSADLVRAYVRHVGGDPSAYKRTLPPHLFPQWGFGLASRCLRDVPYPIARVLNGGCRVVVNAPLPSDEPLRVTARLEGIDDDGRRAVLHTRVRTGVASQPDAIVADMFAIVPLGREGASKKGASKKGASKRSANANGTAPSDAGANGKSAKPNGSGAKNGAGAKAERDKKEKPRVPASATEIARFRLGPSAGLDFAKLTGDFNPVHWIPGYARAFGFRNVILHGFGTMARAWEGLVRGVYAGDASAIGSFDCRFTRPLVLPANVGLYVDGSHGVFVGDAPGGPAYLIGTYGERP